MSSMAGVKKVLLATDGSETALKAAAFAGDLARDCGAELVILACNNSELINLNALGASEWASAGPPERYSIDVMREDIEQETRRSILAPSAEAAGDMSPAPQQIQEWGHAAEVICEYAQTQGVDLIVLGSRGRSGFVKLLLGSVTVQVLNHAQCPVTVVR